MRRADIKAPHATADLRNCFFDGACLIALCFFASPCAAQTSERPPDNSRDLPQIVVSAPPKPAARPKPARSVRAVERGNPSVARRRTNVAPTPQPGDARTPLNGNVVATSASRLGLTVRETPASVEVIDQQTIRDRGFRSVTDIAQGAVGVTAGDSPAEPSGFSMRGFTNSQITTLYNGIKIGPQNMTSRLMDTGNLDRVEILKGPASLISGEGASGGAINLVTRQPHTGKIVNDAFTSYDSFNAFRFGIGSGGSTNIEGLDYRIDFTRASLDGFIDDTNTRNLNVSTQLNYRVSDTFRIFGALEYKQDKSSPYWGTPLVSAAFSGPFATTGIVSGNYISNYNGTNLGPVTIDSRTLRTNYNVLDNRNKADELWLRTGFEWAVSENITLKSQVYGYGAQREYFNNEVIAFNAATGLVDRERFYVAHDQKQAGSVTDLTVNSDIAGRDNRFVTTFQTSSLDFTRPGAANFPGDSVTLTNPEREFYGLLTTQTQTARIDNYAMAFEDRLKLTNALSLIGGLRVEQIALDRTSTTAAGISRAGFPFSKTWEPVTGRVGYTWEPLRGLIFYSQYATGADVAANNIFLLGALQPLDLTRSRTYETGVKDLVWGGKAEWSLSVFDIERQNVYTAQGGQSLNIAGRQLSRGVELAAAVRPTAAWNVWGNFAYVDARYANYNFAGGSFSGNTPPNVPRIVVNAGGSYRFATFWPVEVGFSVRHVGDRFNTDSNAVKLLAYTTADVFAFVDLDRYALLNVEKTRLTFRIRNLTDATYAAWGDPFYPDQILLGAPRSYEVAASFKF